MQKRSRKIVFFCLATTALPAKRDRERESDESLIRKPSPASRLAPCQASSSRGRERKVEVPALQRRESENHPSLVPPKRKRIPKELQWNASATSSLFFFFLGFGLCVLLRESKCQNVSSNLSKDKEKTSSQNSLLFNCSRQQQQLTRSLLASTTMTTGPVDWKGLFEWSMKHQAEAPRAPGGEEGPKVMSEQDRKW